MDNDQPGRLARAVLDARLTVESEFIPWSKSRNYKPETRAMQRTLNWRITLKVEGRDILTTDYSAGVAYCPSYSYLMIDTIEGRELIVAETETGRAHISAGGLVRPAYTHGRAICPNSLDIMHSLLLDASALDCPEYEAWADDHGYDRDSRRGETIYRQCLMIALKLRGALGDTALAKLREAAEDY